jgi:kynurenine formamidase
MVDKLNLPSYDELPIRAGAPPGSAWGVFGDRDELGTLNLLTPQRVREALGEAREGRVIPLNLPLNLPDPPRIPRTPHKHQVAPMGGYDAFVDDTIDGFNTQNSSQWDAIGHMRHPEFGAYNGVPDSELIGRGGKRLGIDNYARKGIAARGVLIDAARYYERNSQSVDHMTAHVISLQDLEAALVQQKTELRTGDILLIRTGWLKYYLDGGPDVRQKLTRSPLPGIENSVAMVRWLWDSRVAAVACDTPALEPTPRRSAQPPQETLHARLLVFLGMPIGELWDLEALAQDCAADGRYSFLLCSMPLNLPGGAGSPPNAMAIK